MYIPKQFLTTDHSEIVAFIKKYSFGTIISVSEGIPVATHLPFLIKEQNEKLILQAHFATANPQHTDITGQVALIIFAEPHAYISPKFYEKELNVPTWNYLAVHVYGKAKIIEDEEGKLNLLEATILNYEEDYLQQWNNLPLDYKLKMLKGITAFEIEISDIQAKKKLSQNRTDKEKENIIQAFEGSLDNNEKQIAEYMKTSPLNP